MKALTIKEPWASLIINGLKEYEFRSWTTNYRGKILIHASLKKDLRISQFKELNLSYQPGYIIGEATIDKIVKVTPKLAQELHNKNPLVYKNVENDIYAWHLVKVKKYKKPILAKGSLGLWNYYSIEEVMDLMDDIAYGWVAQNNKKYGDTDDNFFEEYQLETPQEVIKNKMGVCWDQVELERFYFHNYDVQSYFIAYYGNDECPTHTFLVVKKDNIYYWFEHSWFKYRGIHPYFKEEELLKDVKNKFIESSLPKEYDPDKLYLYAYEKPPKHLGAQEFYNHCEQGKKIII